MSFTKKLALAVSLTAASTAFAQEAETKTSQPIAPVSDPVNFESPYHTTEVRMIYLRQNFQDKIKTAGGSKLKLGGQADLFAVQARYAFSDRFSIIATKDGYAKYDFDNTLEDQEGFANLALGVKYSPIIDEQNNFILTTGFRVEIPTGDDDIYQGKGDGIANPFISIGKQIDDVSFIFYEGLRIPFDTNNNSTYNDMSFHVDYKIGDFYPLVEFHWRHVIASGDGSPFDLELDGGGQAPIDDINPGFGGADLLNLGTSDTQGTNYTNLAVGFRYVVTDNITVGAAYETEITENDEGIFDDRYTFDCIISF